MSRPIVKICCIAATDEANLAIRAGAGALGLVSAMPSGPGPIPEEQIATVVRSIPPGMPTFLLTCETSADRIIAQQKRTGASTLQLCDAVDPESFQRLRAALPGIRIVQVIHVTGEESIEEARDVAPLVDALLLDSGNPRLAIKELGGTGRRHDWAISRRIVETVPKPVWLAGGLSAANVAEAVRTVGPYGLDVCSGVRTNGELDAAKLSAFFEAISP